MSRVRFRFTIVTCNVGRKYRRARQVRAAIASVLRRFPTAVIGWQEIDEADPGSEHGILAALSRRLRTGHRAIAKASSWLVLCAQLACPISLPPIFRATGTDVRSACPGRAKVTPARWIAIVRARLLPGAGVDVVLSFMNGHLPFRAPDLWTQAWLAWQAAVRAEVDAGRLVVITMDSNHHGALPGKIHPRAQLLTHPDGIDRIFVVVPAALERAGLEVELVRLVTEDLHIDGHDADGAVLEVSVPNAA